MKEYDKRQDIIIPIMYSSYFDLTKFDFSKFDIRILNTESKEFQNYIWKLNPDNESFNLETIEKINKEKIGEYNEMYAIVKYDLASFDYTQLENVWKLLLVIYPSTLMILYELLFDKDEKGNYSCHGYSGNNKLFGQKQLFALDEDVNKVNEYINKYFERFNNSNYIGLAIETYIASYFSSHLHFQYLNLLISLESIINGSHELSYRLKRGVAILCGDNEFSSEIIFDNLHIIYSLRSKIIHGEKYKTEKVKNYLPHLKALVSRTIIELIIHDISNTNELNKIITKIGFGERYKISNDWKKYDFNINTIAESNFSELEK